MEEKMGEVQQSHYEELKEKTIQANIEQSYL